MYILPHYRFSDYAMGLMLGYLLRKNAKVKLSDVQVYLGWLIISLLFVATVAVSSLMSAYDYSFSSFGAALFSSLAPIPVCLFFAWMIYTAHLGYKSMVKFSLNHLNILLIFY